MSATPRGDLDWQPLDEHLDWVAPAVAAAADTVPGALVCQIDPALADTAAFCEAHQVLPETSANCVVVSGRRGERTVTAAIMVLASDRADINKTVRKHLDVRKLSFMGPDEAERATGGSQGGITPVGLPADWLVLVDAAVAELPEVVIGGGVRSSKLLVSGEILAGLPNSTVLHLALPRA